MRRGRWACCRILANGLFVKCFNRNYRLNPCRDMIEQFDRPFRSGIELISTFFVSAKSPKHTQGRNNLIPDNKRTEFSRQEELSRYQLLTQPLGTRQ
jgi:hypothetical protein